jgi:hypothetical protein
MERKYSNPTAAHCVGLGLVASTQGTFCVDLRLRDRLGGSRAHKARSSERRYQSKAF